jgi:hypothetical protein
LKEIAMSTEPEPIPANIGRREGLKAAIAVLIPPVLAMLGYALLIWCAK